MIRPDAADALIASGLIVVAIGLYLLAQPFVLVLAGATLVVVGLRRL